MNEALCRGGCAARVWVALGALFVNTGCANLYLHSDTRQQQAETAAKAWAEVDHESLFAAERDNLAKLATAEQDTQARVAAAMRDYLAATITAGGSPGETPEARARRSVDAMVLKRARAEFETLVGPVERHDRQIKAADERAPVEKSVAGLAWRLSGMGSPVLSCADLGEAPALSSAAQSWLEGLPLRARIGADDSLASLRRDCARLKELAAKHQAQGIDTTPMGKMKDAVAQRDADNRDLLRQNAAFQAAKARYEFALAEYNAAEAAAKAPGADATLTAAVGNAAALLKVQIGILRSLNNAFAREFVATETLESIDGALSAIVSGQAGEGASKGVVLAVQAPALIDRYRAAMAEARKPLVLPLLIRRNAEQLQRDAAAADARLIHAKVELSGRIVDAVALEAAALRRSIRELEAAERLRPGALGEPWAEAQAATSGKAKQLLLSGTALYLDAKSRLEGARYKLEYARIAVDHQRGLAYAETSVAQWGNLIGAGVGQLEAFARGGIDKAMLTELAKVLGLLWIGHGVNE